MLGNVKDTEPETPRNTSWIEKSDEKTALYYCEGGGLKNFLIAVGRARPPGMGIIAGSSNQLIKWLK